MPSTPDPKRTSFIRDTGTSAANTAQTVNTPVGRILHLLYVTVKYSATTTSSPTVTLNSGAGSAFDTLLQTIDFTGGATDGVFIPSGDVEIGSDDVIDVTAPAGGVGITSAIAIYTEQRR